MTIQPKFGTSGLRGAAEGLTNDLCAGYTLAFLDLVTELSFTSKTLVLGNDLRPSSRRIASAIAGAAAARGFELTYAGEVPTPAIALEGFSRQAPSIMVTGSHNPAQDNGIKFFLPDSELRKEDEVVFQDISATGIPPLLLPTPDPQPLKSYLARFRMLFPGKPLGGLKIGVDMHSAVGGKSLAELLSGMGAGCVQFGTEARFTPVDTEALSSKRMNLARSAIRDGNLDAVVSTDGDGDRPLLIAESGEQINGDVLGILAAKFLGYRAVVTPVSTTTALEKSKYFQTVRRTRIGSPYVIAEMTRLGTETSLPIAGFEANGGFICGGELEWRGRIVHPLMTRDAILPLLAVLVMSVERRLNLTGLAAELPNREKRSGRLQSYRIERSQELLTVLRTEISRARFMPELGQTTHIDETDGVRMTLQDGRIIHFRPSGNAPELRCYVESDNAGISTATLQKALEAAERFEP